MTAAISRFSTQALHLFKTKGSHLLSSLNYRENPDHGSCNKHYARKFLRLKLCIVVQSATSELTATILLACPSSASLHPPCFTELIPPTQPAERYSLFFAEVSFVLIQQVKSVQCKIRQSPGLTSEE